MFNKKLHKGREPSKESQYQSSISTPAKTQATPVVGQVTL